MKRRACPRCGYNDALEPGRYMGKKFWRCARLFCQFYIWRLK